MSFKKAKAKTTQKQTVSPPGGVKYRSSFTGVVFFLEGGNNGFNDDTGAINSEADMS